MTIKYDVMLHGEYKGQYTEEGVKEWFDIWLKNDEGEEDEIAPFVYDILSEITILKIREGIGK